MTVAHEAERPREAPGDFWGRFIADRTRAEGARLATLEQMENAFSQSFPSVLKSNLLNFLAAQRVQREYERPFGFVVHSISYTKSMSFILDVVGLETLSRYLNKEFELLEIFFQQYLPTILESQLHDAAHYKMPLPWTSPENLNLIIQTEIFEQMGGASQQQLVSGTTRGSKPGTRPAPNTSDGRTSSAKFAWAVSNLSLVMPVILSLFILYVTYAELQAERREIFRVMQALSERDQARMEAADRERVALMELLMRHAGADDALERLLSDEEVSSPAEGSSAMP